MAYKAQLVVRARNKEGVEIIEKVKELANDKGVTYSEMAVDLLGVVLSGGGGAAESSAAAPTADAKDDGAAKEEAKPKAEAKAAKPTPKVERRRNKPAHPRAPLPAEEAGPAVNPKLPPAEILKHYMARREEKGERAAGRILVDFFAEAGPAAGGKLKKLLQKQYTDEDFEALMEPIKDTDEYRTYTQRAIFEAPSPYSQMS